MAERRASPHIVLLSMQMVMMENAEEYVELMFDFCMHTGIQKQMEAFKGTHTHTLFLSVVSLFNIFLSCTALSVNLVFSSLIKIVYLSA